MAPPLITVSNSLATSSWTSLKRKHGEATTNEQQHTFIPDLSEDMRRFGRAAERMRRDRWSLMRVFKGMERFDLTAPRLPRKHGGLPFWCESVTTMTCHVGHSGYTAIAMQAGERNGWWVRRGIYERLQKDAYLAQILSDDQISMIQRRLFLNGAPPHVKDALQHQGTDQPAHLWLHPMDLWLVAQYYRRPVCVFFDSRVTYACTYLPLASSWPRPPQPIGLMLTQNGWAAVSVREAVTLPPVRLGGWSLRAREHTVHKDHQYWHKHFRFAPSGGVDLDDGTCGCMPRKAHSEDDMSAQVRFGC